MKAKHKITSIILIISLITTVFPFAIFADTVNNKLTPVLDFKDPNAISTGKIISEDLSLRERNAKQFYKDNHTYEAAIYPFSVHYLENGKWKDIDNSLIEGKDESNNPVLENKANEFKVKIAKNTKANKLVRIKKDNYELSWGLNNVKESLANVKSLKARAMDTLSENEKKMLVTNSNSVVDFKNVFDNIDLQYVVQPSGVKENIIINQKVDNPKFEFSLNVSNLIPKVLENNSIIFYDINDANKVVYEMGAPFMVDGKGEISNDILISLSTTSNGYILTLTPNNEWLSDSSRIYPVTIDPPVTLAGDGALTKDSFVSENYPTTSYNSSDRLKTGFGSSSGKNRTYLSFNLPGLTTADVVTKAELYLDLMNTKTTENQIDVHKVKAQWDNSTLNWSNKPENETNVSDYQLVQGLGAYKWDITPIVQDWYINGNNFGLMLKDKDESASSYTEFYSSNNTSITATQTPRLKIEYTKANGLESYWPTEIVSAGRAGTAFVNSFSGNLLFIHNDISMDGNRMPISINHVFNNTDRSTNSGFGFGWRLNLDQVVLEEIIGGVKYLVYVDEDRTRHYFKETSTVGVYQDQSGLNLTLTVDSPTTYTIKDKYDNSMHFTKLEGDSHGRYFLDSIADNKGNKMTLTYNGALLTKVSDGVGRTVTLNYTDGLLTSITDPYNRTTSYDYTDNKLTKITYPDGKYTMYNYDSNRSMQNVINNDNFKLSFTTYPASPYRVKDIEESNHIISGALGNKIALIYGNRSTKVTDYENGDSYYTFNDYGNAINIRDGEGNALFFQYGTGTNVNKTTFVSKNQKTVINLLRNHSLEAASYWIASNSADSVGTSTLTTADKIFGKQSLEINKTNNLGAHAYQQNLNLEKNKQYTFSGFVKTAGITNTNNKGAYLYISYQDSAGAWKKSASKYINGTNGWQRMEASFKLPEDAVSTSVHFKLALDGETGSAFFDGLQVEEGSIANRYNLIENADFNYGIDDPIAKTNEAEFWSRTNTNTTIDRWLQNESPTVGLDHKNFKLTGEAKVQKYIYQHIYQSGNAGDAYTIGGWGKGDAVAVAYPKSFAITVGITRLDGTVQWETSYFNRDSSNWQYAIKNIVADSDYSKITVFLVYYENINEAYFDGIQLYKEIAGRNIAYDSKGNVIYTQNLAGNNAVNHYNVYNDLDKYTDEKGNITVNNYDAINYNERHLLQNTISPESIKTSYSYDSYGNALTTRINNVASESPYISASATYTADGNYTKTITDAAGNTGTFDYHIANGIINGNIKSYKDGKGHVVNYSYDPNTDALTDIYMITPGGEVRNKYVYQNDKLKTISHNGFSYDYSYNALGNLEKVSVGTQILLTNKYTMPQNTTSTVSRLEQIDFKNSNTIKFDYTKDGILKSEAHDGSKRFEYEFDSNGNLGYMLDLFNNISYRYFYDVEDRLTGISDSNGNSIEFLYEPNDNIDKIHESFVGIKYSTDYSYNKDNRITDIIYNSARNTMSYLYDGLGRTSQTQLKVNGISKYSTLYSYKNGVNAGSTTLLLDQINNSGEKISYTYDANGNIETITHGEGTGAKVIEYQYDQLNQLKRENNQVIGKTILYSYDNGGNILSKTDYAYTTAQTPASPTKIDSYGYTDPVWKDKLTSFNGGTIAYDANGNITQAGVYSYNWKSGTELASMSGQGQTLSFEYNQDGIRTQKKKVTATGTTTTKYHTLGDKVLFETNGTDNIHYTYGADDKLISMNLNGFEYYYIRNGQGDIIGLANDAGVKVVSYTYDTWGNLAASSDTSGVALAAKNPYRYRGYRYDTETGLYYLNARYYNPYIGRFMSADAYIGDGSLLSHNLYAYTRNNPVNRWDPNGYYDLETPKYGVPSGFSPPNKTPAVPAKGVGVSNTSPTKASSPSNVRINPKYNSNVSRANSSFDYDLLSKDLKYTEKYGISAKRALPDGRIRYYGKVEPASKAGEMAGRRIVQELDPKTGNVRTWHETLDKFGNTRQVRPQQGPVKTHFTFDIFGNYTGKW